MSDPALHFQRLPRERDRVIAAMAVAEGRTGDGFVSRPELEAVFVALRVQPPSNTGRELARLVSDRLLIQHQDRWAVTPEGRAATADLLGDLPVEHLVAAQVRAFGADFGATHHATLPPGLAPMKWVREVADFNADFPFEGNVFAMTRFPAAPGDTTYLDPIADAVSITRSALAEKGLTLHLAADRQIVDDLLGNVAAHMWGSKYGIGFLENRRGSGLNYNVVVEVGAMLVTGRRCALLKDVSAPDLPSDIAGQIYKPVDLSNLDAVRSLVSAWVTDDLRVT